MQSKQNHRVGAHVSGVFFCLFAFAATAVAEERTDCSAFASESRVTSDALRQMSEEIVSNMLASDTLREAQQAGERPRVVVLPQEGTLAYDDLARSIGMMLIESGSVRVFNANAQTVVDANNWLMMLTCERNQSSFALHLTLSSVAEPRIVRTWSSSR